VGPAIAGLAIGWIGEGWCFFLNGVSFLAVIIALLMMRLDKFEPRAGKGSPLQNFVQGFRFAMSDRPIRSVLLLVSLMSMFGLQYSVFMPIFARDILHGGPRMLGFLMLCAGVGAVNGALHFAAWTNYKSLVEWIAATSTACALGLIFFSVSHVLWLSAVMLVAIGFSATSQLAATNTIVQNRVPDELRSRLMAVYATMFMGVQPIGALFAGGLAKTIGAPHALMTFGTICLLGSLFFAFRVAMRLGQTQGSTEPQAGLGR
jgi:predicted MFS family arabinose efflux permease